MVQGIQKRLLHYFSTRSLNVNITKLFNNAHIVGCFDVTQTPFKHKLLEFSEIIQLKCGFPPYSVYVSSKIFNLFETDLCGFEIQIANLPNENSVILCAPMGGHGSVARFTVYGI